MAMGELKAFGLSGALFASLFLIALTTHYTAAKFASIACFVVGESKYRSDGLLAMGACLRSKKLAAIGMANAFISQALQA
jgi:hypothetical protein